MNRTVPLLMAVAALCACTTAARGAPAPTPGWDWRMVAREDSATLAYAAGPARKLEVECRGGQDPELALMAWVPNPPAKPVHGGGGKPEEVILIADGKRQIYPTLTEANDGGWEMMWHARKNDLVIQAFRETGWLSVTINGRTERFIPTHGNTAVADFFEWCQ